MSRSMNGFSEILTPGLEWDQNDPARISMNNFSGFSSLRCGEAQRSDGRFLPGTARFICACLVLRCRGKRYTLSLSNRSPILWRKIISLALSPSKLAKWSELGSLFPAVSRTPRRFSRLFFWPFDERVQRDANAFNFRKSSWFRRLVVPRREDRWVIKRCLETRFLSFVDCVWASRSALAHENVLTWLLFWRISDHVVGWVGEVCSVTCYGNFFSLQNSTSSVNILNNKIMSILRKNLRKYFFGNLGV